MNFGDEDREKVAVDVVNYQTFSKAPFLVISEWDEGECDEGGPANYRHHLWAIYNNVVVEKAWADSQVDEIIDFRQERKLPFAVSKDKPYTMPNGEIITS